jgi:hypothetical protein
LPGQKHLSAVGRLNARDDPRQRALAGAVLANEGVDLAGTQIATCQSAWTPGKALSIPVTFSKGPVGEDIIRAFPP